MRTLYLFIAFSVVIVSLAVAQTETPQRQLKIMPLPADFQLGPGELPINQSFSVAITGYKEARLESAVQRFLADMSRRTGIAFKTQLSDPGKATLVIRTDHESKKVQEPTEDESYALEVSVSAARLSAPNPLGILHGLQTLLQLLEATPSGFAIPVITIHDTPRFAWRGLLIDSSRHFIPLDVIRRNLDAMAAVKMNVFHWHLSDNQGFRVESKKFPKLHQMGSDGSYYTQAELRDLIGYARDRGIRVIAEFDMPGHSTSWFLGYPELASGPGPFEIERKFGVFDPAIDPTRESTYKFLDGFIGEMAKLFPDHYFHIGGDEVNGKAWDGNAKIQEFKRAHGMKSNEELQEYFTKRVQKIVSKYGKTMVGWDEILTPGIPKDIVIQSWRGQESLAAAARQGYRGLLSNGYYIDLIWPAWRHYEVDPMGGNAAGLSAEEQKRILGGEATMWSEFVSGETIDSRIWPRTAAIAERLWSPQEVKDVKSMYDRLERIGWLLDSLGVTHDSSYVPMLQRIADSPNVSALRVLADVVEPVKDYTRGELAKWEATTSDPLNRLVDAARPESDKARAFSSLIDSYVATRCRDAAQARQLRNIFTKWRDQGTRLPELMSKSFLFQESSQLSQNLSALGIAGLAALDYAETGLPAPDAWKTGQMAIVEEAKKPSAQLLLIVAAPLQKLIEATSAGGACPSRK